MRKLIFVVAALSLLATPGFAQRGGDRGGRGGDRSGDRGGLGGGDRGGGDRGGGRGGFDASGFLSRMDKNGNGVLERGEVDGRAEGWLKRSYPEANFDRGVKISDLAKRIEAARSNRDGGRQEEKEDGYDISALVPGFGEVVEIPPVINFGSTPENYVEITDADRARARSTMDRYDRNKDGKMDNEERNRSSRWGDDDPIKYDANRDGKVSLNELATRYAHRRRKESEEKAGDNNSDQDRRRRREREPEPPKVEVITSRDKQPRYVTAVDRLPSGLPDWFAEKDKDEDGQVSMAEYLVELATEEVDKFIAMDTDNDGTLIAAELGVKPDAKDETKSRGSRDGRESTDDRRSRFASRDSSVQRSDSSSWSGRTSSTNRSTSTKSTASTSKSAEKKVAEKKAADPDALAAKYQKYAAGRMKAYDANRDGVLSLEECKANNKKLLDADADKNGMITTEEVASFYQKLYAR